MAFFYSFTDSLKHKWLQFFQVNRDWIKLHMEVESVYTPDGGKRPASYLILGVVNALEPKLAQLMLPFSRLNPDADTLIEVLDLNFDPDIALGNFVVPKPERSEEEDESVGVRSDQPDDETLTSETNGFDSGAIAPEMEMHSHEETLMVSDTTIRDEMRAMSIPTHNIEFVENSSPQQENSNSESQQTSQVDVEDAFGEISFDQIKEVDNNNFATTASEENGFAEVLSDVWGDEANTDIFGEEPSTNVFDDSEIARLFPNA